jgi:hypothetical protein
MKSPSEGDYMPPKEKKIQPLPGEGVCCHRAAFVVVKAFKHSSFSSCTCQSLGDVEHCLVVQHCLCLSINLTQSVKIE